MRSIDVGLLPLKALGIREFGTLNGFHIQLDDKPLGNQIVISSIVEHELGRATAASYSRSGCATIQWRIGVLDFLL
jgi:hypothetical protein